MTFKAIVKNVKLALLVFAATGILYGEPGVCTGAGIVVDSMTGNPIPRVRLNVSAYTSVVTDAGGKWQIANVPCSGQRLFFEKTGFQPFNLPLTADVLAHDITVKLVPQSVIFGKVLDNAGDPVMGAQVTLSTSRVVEGKIAHQPVGSSSSNDLGEFRMPGLRAGKYVVCMRSRQMESCYPGPPDEGVANGIQLPAGRETRVDFTVGEATTIDIRGTVTGLPTGKNTAVRLMNRAGLTEINRNAAVDRDGRFDLAGVARGSYWLLSDYFEAGKQLHGRMALDVGTSDIDGLTLPLETGFSVSGTLRVTSGHLTRTIPGSVVLRGTDMAPLMGAAKWGADQSTFVVSDIVTGTYRLDFTPPPPFYVESARLGSQDFTSGPVALSPGAGPIEITLRDDGGSLEGDADAQSGILLLGKNGRRLSISTDPLGHFVMINVPPGDYTAYAWDDITQVLYGDPQWMRQNGGSGVGVSVGAGQRARVTLKQQAVPPL
jgi:hypothetical protein